MSVDLHRARVCGRGGRAGFWRSVRADLNNRGVWDILITCCDGLAGFENAITSGFPRALQRCVVHDAARPVTPTSRRELVRRSYEPRKGQPDRGGLADTRLFGSAEEEGGGTGGMPSAARVTGGLARHTAGFVAELGRLGYTGNSAG